MNTIEINNTGIKVDVSVFLFKEDDEFDFTHDCTNKVELIAVKMAMIIWTNCFQKSFFINV